MAEPSVCLVPFIEEGPAPEGAGIAYRARASRETRVIQWWAGVQRGKDCFLVFAQRLDDISRRVLKVRAKQAFTATLKPDAVTLGKLDRLSRTLPPCDRKRAHSSVVQ
jgi:hypothetical protein